MSDSTKVVPDRSSEASGDGLEWVPKEIAQTPPEPPLFRRFAPTKGVPEARPSDVRRRPSRREQPGPTVRPQPAPPAPKAAAKAQVDGIDAEVARRLELAEEEIARAGRAVERSTLALAKQLEPGDRGRTP